MTQHWVCVASRWLVPPVPCDARGTGDSGAARHTEKAPHHPTFTTTNLAAANALAATPNGRP